MPQTVGPFKSPEILQHALKSLERASYVLPRDHKSYQFCIEKIKNPNISELIDLAFYLPFEPFSFTRNKVHVGISISRLLWNGGYKKENDFAFIDDYQSLIHQIIDYFISDPSVVLHLVPHVVSGDNFIEEDYALSYSIYTKYKSEQIVLAPFFKNPIMAKNYISGLDFFIGSRMHACIAAFSSGVPVIPLSYSRKFTGLFCDTLGYNLVLDLSTVDNCSALSLIKQSFRNRNSIKEQVYEINQTVVQQKKTDLLNCLKEILQ